MIKIIDVIEAKDYAATLKKARRMYPKQVTKIKLRYSAKAAHSRLSGYAVHVDTTKGAKLHRAIRSKRSR
jgi:hypothetical protein